MAQFGVNFVKINLTSRHLIGGVFKIVFEDTEVFFVHFVDQMHRHIVELICNGMGAFWSVPFAFVKAWDPGEIDGMGSLGVVEHVLHAGVEIFGPENFVVAPTVHDERRDVAGHGGPMDVRLHRAAPADGIAGEKQEPPKALDLVEFETVFRIADFNSIFLDQERDKIAAIVFAVALDTTDFVKE